MDWRRPAWRDQVLMIRRLLTSSLILVGLAVLLPSDALAQRGGPGRGPSRGPVVVVSPQRTVVYPPWYGPWGSPYGYGGYPYPYPGQYPYRYDSDEADLRIQTTPRETEVYVDGARAGIVDDFDGIFQRLHLRPGDHEITLYLAGYRSWNETRYFGPHSDQRMLHTMLPLASGQPDDLRPARVSPPIQIEPRVSEPRAPETPVIDPRSFGTLSVSVTPPDAEITLDGQKQPRPGGTSGNRFVIQLTEGVHRLVITKNGFDSFETDLQIRRGRTLSFDVNLVK